jgi:hypothetical protein
VSSSCKHSLVCTLTALVAAVIMEDGRLTAAKRG